MGQLVRVLPGLFHARPRDFSEVAKQRELYYVFYTLNRSLGDGQAAIVSNQPVPQWAQQYPLMRWSAARDSTGRTIAWKIIEASTPLTLETHQRTPILHELTPEQKRLSVHVLRPHPSMVRELARGWTPEREEEMRLHDVAEAAEPKRGCAPGKIPSADEPMRHFLYFPKQTQAEKAGRQLRGRGFSVEVRRAAVGGQWLTLATGAPPGSGVQMADVRDEMEALAANFGGEYDGWELPV